MPVSMKAVLQSIQYSERAVEIAQKEIDAKLCDPGQLRDAVPEQAQH